MASREAKYLVGKDCNNLTCDSRYDLRPGLETPLSNNALVSSSSVITVAMLAIIAPFQQSIAWRFARKHAGERRRKEVRPRHPLKQTRMYPSHAATAVCPMYISDFDLEWGFFQLIVRASTGQKRPVFVVVSGSTPSIDSRSTEL